MLLTHHIIFKFILINFSQFFIIFQGKLAKPRMLHCTHWGMVCPAETPGTSPSPNHTQHIKHRAYSIERHLTWQCVVSMCFSILTEEIVVFMLYSFYITCSLSFLPIHSLSFLLIPFLLSLFFCTIRGPCCRTREESIAHV